MIEWIATFVAALAVGLYRQWQLALFLCAIVPFMAIAAGVFARVSICKIIQSHCIMIFCSCVSKDECAFIIQLK